MPNDRWRRAALVSAGIAGAALLVAAVAGLSAWLTVHGTISGRTISVPDLTEMTTDEAGALLKKNGLVLESVAERNDERVEAGRILAQDPPAGADIKIDRKVKVVVSLGNEVSSIPELRGGAARRAQITLQQQGLRLGEQVYVHNRRVAENLVIAQDPLPQSAGLREGKVTLLISRGAPERTWVMPDLAGRSEREAAAFLARAGLRVGPVRRDSTRAAAPGTIVAHTPPSGYPVKSGDLVSLTVAGESDGG